MGENTSRQAAPPLLDCDGRRDPRRKLHLVVPWLRSGDRSGIVIHNLSSGGALIEPQEPVDVGQEIDIEFPILGPVSATIVWRRGDVAGCRFARPLSKGTMSAAFLRSGPELRTGGSTRESAPGFDDAATTHATRLGYRLLAIGATALCCWLVLGGLLWSVVHPT